MGYATGKHSPLKLGLGMTPTIPGKDAGAGKLKVAIIGGGLVGSLSACFLAKRGHDVTVYEFREDIRQAALVQGRSINLAMSVRARTALRELGLEDKIIKEHGIPMAGRMIHSLNGNKYPIPYDSVNNQCIYSVGRKYVNETLLTAAESYPTVKTLFQQKLISVNLEEGIMTFLKTETQEKVIERADLIIGADGAYSSVRKEMMKQPMFDYSQNYIPHGYLELCIPPTKAGEFAMEENFLHIWPRGSFMMIALPNQDRTWTVTLFMPFENFATLTTPDKLMCFFETNFPDSIPLIGEDKLIRDFFATTASHLVSVKCNPYHIGNKSLIIGDAAHAMVPFYGQGMNAGFEDCFILDKLLDKYNANLSKVLPEFSKQRNPDAEAICDLAMYNYVEMRDLVNRKTFLMRKKVDNLLYRLLPSHWVPLYNSVTFTTMRYSHCIRNRGFQDKVIDRGIIFITATIVLILSYFLFL